MNNLSRRIAEKREEEEKFLQESTLIESQLRKKWWHGIYGGGRFLSAVAYILPQDVSLAMTKEQAPRVALMQYIYLSATESLLVHSSQRDNYKSCWYWEMNDIPWISKQTRMTLFAFEDNTLRIISSPHNRLFYRPNRIAWSISSIDWLALIKEKK